MIGRQDMIEYLDSKAGMLEDGGNTRTDSSIHSFEEGVGVLRKRAETAYRDLAALAGHIMYPSNKLRIDIARDACDRAGAALDGLIDAYNCDLLRDEDYISLSDEIKRAEEGLRCLEKEIDGYKDEHKEALKKKGRIFRRLYERKCGAVDSSCSPLDDIIAKVVWYRRRSVPVHKLETNQKIAEMKHDEAKIELDSMHSRLTKIIDAASERAGIPSGLGKVEVAERELKAAEEAVVSKLKLTIGGELLGLVSGKRYSDEARELAQEIVGCKEAVSRYEAHLRKWKGESA